MKWKVWNWNETYITGTLMRNNIELLPAKLNMFNSEFDSLVSAQGGAFKLNEAYKMAATLISISPLLILYAFVQKQFIPGKAQSLSAQTQWSGLPPSPQTTVWYSAM